MKKFLNVRNVIIVLVIFVAIFAIVFMSPKNPYDSKTSKLYYKWVNQDEITLKLSSKHGFQEETLIFSTDKNNNKTVKIIDVYDNDNKAKEENRSHIKSITIMENGKTHMYQINYDLKNYKDLGESENAEDITAWMETPNNIVNTSKYYTKKQHTINGKRVFTEVFDKGKAYFGYEDDELVIVQTEEKDYAYNVSTESKFIDESLYEIPEDFSLDNAGE